MHVQQDEKLKEFRGIIVQEHCIGGDSGLDFDYSFLIKSNEKS
jgi:hypothetical protein